MVAFETIFDFCFDVSPSASALAIFDGFFLPLPFFRPRFSRGSSLSLLSMRSCLSRRLRPFDDFLRDFSGPSSLRGILASLPPESDTYSSRRPRPPLFLRESGGGSENNNAFFVFSLYSCRFSSISSLFLCRSASRRMRSSSWRFLNAARSSSCF